MPHRLPGSQRAGLPTPAVQLITGAWRDPADLLRRVEAALRGGIRWVQLRAKDRSASELYAAACRLAPLVREAGGPFVVNDRVDVAAAAGASGVHLPEDGMSTRDARRVLGGEAWIARSVHSIDAIRALGDDDLDAIQFGPVFETASKLGFGAPQGLARLSRAAEAAARAPNAPGIVAVGGITVGRVADCRAAGAAAVSVIGAIWDADDVEAAARGFTAG